MGFILMTPACTKQPSPSPSAPFKLTASIQDLMAAEVDPAADYLWAAISSEISAAGTVDRAPHTDEEWLAARHQAIILLEAANLLVMEGRQVAAPGKQLEDSHVPGILTAPQIQQAIDADRAKFIDHAHQLHDAGVSALAAIDAKNGEGLSEAGAAIDSACESCHLTYWYPNTQRPEAAQK
jgi:hypothetical protein